MADRMMSLADLVQAYQQQNPMNDPNVTIQPQGRYMGNQWLPHSADQMVRPSPLPPDMNTLRPEDIMSLGMLFRQERI